MINIVEVKAVESQICIQQTIGTLFIVVLVPGVNHALQKVLFTTKIVDNVKLPGMDFVLDQVRFYLIYFFFIQSSREYRITKILNLANSTINFVQVTIVILTSQSEFEKELCIKQKYPKLKWTNF